MLKRGQFFLILIFFSTLLFGVQDVNRQQPKEWENLIYGGQFSDRFLPMQKVGELTSDCWGDENVKPRDVLNGIEDNKYSYWGGNILQDEAGFYHLYVARWRESSLKGHMAWPYSEVVHAFSEDKAGPYKVIGYVGKGHNPEAYRRKDGKYVISVIDGIYLSNHMDGPWKYRKLKFPNTEYKVVRDLSNMTFAEREDGSFVVVSNRGGLWISEDGHSYYQILRNGEIFPKVEGDFEDPFVWKTDVQYHMIVNDWRGRVGYHLRSKDGTKWVIDPGEAYSYRLPIHEDGTSESWYKLERMKVLKDKYNRVIQANFAVIDTFKRSDKANDIHSSKNLTIPLIPGKLLEILGDNEISKNSSILNLKIRAERGFNPSTDIDFSTLRFGAPQVVDFGGGAKFMESRKDGENLILTFKGLGNGFKDSNFAGKLIGKTTSGKLLFGYVKLPWINYSEPILTASRKAKIKKKGSKFIVELGLKNMGLGIFEGGKIEVQLSRNGETFYIIGNSPSIPSYSNRLISVEYDGLLKWGFPYDIKLYINSQEIVLKKSKISVY